MKRLSLTIGILLAALAPASRGQRLQLVPDISLAEAEYHDAAEAWRQSDPSLESDLLKRSPDEMRQRVHHAAALRDDAMKKKIAYLDAITARLQDTRQRISQANAGAIPTDALKKDLVDQQSRILGEQERLEALLNDLPPGDEYLLVRRPLEEERTNLVNLQNNIALRLRSLDNIDKAQQAIQSDPLAKNLDDLLKIWDQEKATASRQRTMWASLYTEYERAINQKSPAARPAAVRTGALPPAPKSKDTDRRRSPEASSAKGGVAPAGLAGSWVYRSQPGAWTGYGEPEAVTLELKDEGGLLRGTYTARLPSRGGVHDVELVLQGPRQSPTTARLHWTSRTPEAEGDIDLKLSADGRLLLDRSQSGDGYIPLGMEVLLRP